MCETPFHEDNFVLGKSLDQKFPMRISILDVLNPKPYSLKPPKAARCGDIPPF